MVATIFAFELIVRKSLASLDKKVMSHHDWTIQNRLTTGFPHTSSNVILVLLKTLFCFGYYLPKMPCINEYFVEWFIYWNVAEDKLLLVSHCFLCMPEVDGK